MLLTIPNILSIFRIIAAPLLILSGWLEVPILFFILLGAMLLSDAVDGFIARQMHQTSSLGARLDSYGDILTYISTLIGAWFLWPDLVRNELTYIIAAVMIYIAPGIVAFLKFGKLVSYHTWITKILAIFMSIGIVILLVFEKSFIFHMAIYLLIAVVVENIAITLLLKEPREDIPSLWHLLKKKH